MGCKVCRGKIEENQFDFSNQKNKKETLDNLLKQNECEYISEDEFNSAIPEDYLNKIKENINIPEELKEIKGFDVKPIKFKNENIFKGKWNLENKMEGNGIYYLKHDNVLVQGIWKNGELIYGKILLPDNSIYEGYIINSKFNGKGKLITEDKEYEGTFENGEFIEGKIKFPEAEFEGKLEKDEFKNGKMTWNNGYIYEGDFNGYNLQGKGKLIGPENGDIYEGDFDNNLFHGIGKYIYSKTQNEYEGEFEQGIIKGKGKFTEKDKLIYEGTWDNNLPHGIGKIMNIDNTCILKSAFRYGKMVDEPTYEKGQKEDMNFDINELVIEPEEMKLKIKDLKYLSIFNSEATQFKLKSLPSFLNE